MEYQKIGLSVIMLVSPFVAWASYGLGLLIDKILGRKAFNGASVFNWLTFGMVVVTALANEPERAGGLAAAFAISWFVGRRLSKKYKLSTSNGVAAAGEAGNV